MKRLVGITLVLLFVSACVTRPASEVRNQISDVATLRDWSITGRMGITGVAQAGSAGFRWQQHNETSQVNLHGPLGIGSVSIEMSDMLHITLANGDHYDADAALRELDARLGTAVPIKQLSYWLRGIPAPGEFAWRADTIKVLQQDGWRIEYGDVMTVSALQLPKKITAIRDPVRIKVIIDEWTTP